MSETLICLMPQGCQEWNLDSNPRLQYPALNHYTVETDLSLSAQGGFPEE